MVDTPFLGSDELVLNLHQGDFGAVSMTEAIDNTGKVWLLLAVNLGQVRADARNKNRFSRSAKISKSNRHHPLRV